MNCDVPEFKSIVDDLYCTMFESVIEEKMLNNYSQKVIARESKLSVRSVTPYTKSQVNFLNGNQFFGDLNDCRMSGSGRYLWADDSSLYEGEFKRPNVIEGHGSFKFQNRDKTTGFSKYCGKFFNGKFNGKGLLTNPFFKFNGNFEANKFHDRGSIKSGVESFEGIFDMDQKVCGKRVYVDGVFTGDFHADETRKFGKYEFDNGDVYFGSFENGKLSGFGEYSWASENGVEGKYIGHWRHNYREGLGLLKVGEMCCVTIFHKNLKVGPAMVWARNGKVYASNKMFHHDEFLSCKEIEVNETNVNVLRNLLDIKELQLDYFNNMVTLLVNDSGKIGAPSIYPFFTCWFDLKVEHAIIWDFICGFPDTDKEQEFTSITQTIKEFAHVFQELHSRYASFSAKCAGKEVSGMLRIGLWQLMHDLEIYKKSALFNTQLILEEADQAFNILSMNPNDPFDVVSTQNLVQYLMFITLYINMHHDYVLSCAVNQRSKIFGLFATMLVILLREFVCPTLAEENSKGLIPQLIKDDRTFATNFVSIIDLGDQKLSVRKVFKIIEFLTSKQTVNDSKHFIERKGNCIVIRKVPFNL